MRRHPPPTFEQLEVDAQLFARRLVKRDACPCCVTRALLFSAMELAYASNTLPQVRDTLRSLLEATLQDASEPATH